MGGEKSNSGKAMLVLQKLAQEFAIIQPAVVCATLLVVFFYAVIDIKAIYVKSCPDFALAHGILGNLAI